MAIKGYVDGVIGGSVLGWAHDPDRPGKRLELEIRVDDALVGRCVADIERDDLARAGIGDGRHGFRQPLEARLTPGRHRIVVEAIGERAVLPLARDHFADQPAVTLTVHDAPASESAPSEPLVGLDGWLFARSSAQRLERAVGHRPLGPARLHALAAAVRARDEQLRALGVRYLIVTVPDKACVYAEHLPPGLTPAFESRPGAQLARALRTAPRLRPLDLLATLRDGRADGRVSTRTGAELTWLGAFHAYHAVVRELALRGVTGDPMPVSRLDRGALVPVGDGREREPELEPERIPDGPVGGPRALVVHDGSGERLLPFLAAHFSLMDVRATTGLPLADIESARYAVVIQIVADGGPFFD